MATMRIKEEVMEPFRKAVLHKHGKLWGNLKKETHIALQQHTKKMLEESTS